MMAALGLSLLTARGSAQAPEAEPAPSSPPATSRQARLVCPPQAYCEQVDLGPPDDGDDELLPPPGCSGQHSANRDGPRKASCASEAADGAPAEGPLTTAGATIFGLGYGPALILGLIGAALDEVGSAAGGELMPFMLPVLGPPIAGAIWEPSKEVWTVLLVDSAIQALGITLMAVGLSMDDKKAAATGPVIRPHVATDGRHNMMLGLAGAF